MTNYQWQPTGSQIVVTQPNGYRVIQQFNALGQLRYKTDNLPQHNGINLITNTYNDMGQVTTTTQLGKQQTFYRDAQGQIVLTEIVDKNDRDGTTTLSSYSNIDYVANQKSLHTHAVATDGKPWDSPIQMKQLNGQQQVITSQIKANNMTGDSAAINDNMYYDNFGEKIAEVIDATNNVKPLASMPNVSRIP